MNSPQIGLNAGCFLLRFGSERLNLWADPPFVHLRPLIWMGKQAKGIIPLLEINELSLLEEK